MSRKDDNSTITSIVRVPSINKSSFDLICESDLMMELFSTVRTRISGVSGWSLQQKPYFTNQTGLYVYREWREGDKMQIVIKNPTHMTKKIWKKQKIAGLEPTKRQEHIIHSVDISETKPSVHDNKITDLDGNELQISSKLSKVSRKKAVTMLRKYIDMFTQDIKYIRPINVKPAKIILKDKERVQKKL